MRTIEQISKISKTIEDPVSVRNFLDINQLTQLIEIFNNQRHRYVHKNTGPITLDLNFYRHEPVVIEIFEKLEQFLGNYEITAAFFFRTDYPHIIHNDDTFELPDSVYKAVTLPLFLENFSGTYPKLCFFDQFYFHGPAKFFKGSKNIPTYYNQQIYEYDNVTGLTDNILIDKENYFTHLNPQWLEGLSLNSVQDWIPGNAIIFDSVRLHCASDFRNLKIKSKLGISIFTKKI